MKTIVQNNYKGFNSNQAIYNGVELLSLFKVGIMDLINKFQ